ncbi:hypothetical protein DNO06_25270, partial [Escherichia coli]|uniref:hypothetical protein n=1 Tax=Escherichia coli TaxID=562 RepID=UPI001594AC1E
LTQPLFSFRSFTFSARDLIMLFGGFFLLFKATMELNERLEGKSTGFRSQLGVMLPNICQLMPLALFLAKISGSTLKIIHYANRG